MQVNLNPSVNQVRPNFKALKSVKFEGEALQNCARAQKELLTIFDHPKLKSLFKKYDAQVLFDDSYYKPHNAFPYCTFCQIDIFGCHEKEFSKMKSKYIDKAKEAKVSTDRIKNAIYPFAPSRTIYLSKSAIGGIVDRKDLYTRCQEIVKSVNDALGSADGEDVVLNEILDEYKGNINIFFDKILKEEIKLKKESYEEVIAKNEVANKLKELLGE